MQQNPSVSRMQTKSVLISRNLFSSPDIYSAKRTLMLAPCGLGDAAPKDQENRREHLCLTSWATWEISTTGAMGKKHDQLQPVKPPANGSIITMPLMLGQAETLSHLLFVSCVFFSLLCSRLLPYSLFQLTF